MIDKCDAKFYHKNRQKDKCFEQDTISRITAFRKPPVV